jgi:integrase
MLDLYFADWSLVPKEDRDLVPDDRSMRVTSGTPIVVDEAMRAVEPWCTFLRLYSENISKRSVQAYALDAVRFARFLESQDVDVLAARQSDLVAYRRERLASGLALRSWSRELVVIRAFFKFLCDTGQRETLPWIKVGSRSVVTPRVPRTDMDVRALSHAQWVAFQRVGLGGELPNGSLDCSFRGRNTVRNSCAAELALTSGMRLSEWCSLLGFEVAATDSGASLVLQACAKNGRRRRVYIPASTVRSVELYRNTERLATIRKAQKSLAARFSTSAVVNEIDAARGVVTYQLNGRTETKAFPEISPSVRRLLVQRDKDGWIEPLSLFVGRGGLPPSQRRWHQYFEEANKRLARLNGLLPAMPAAISPHDLRHTFAIVLLRSLQARAAQLERSRPMHGAGTISEHIIHNPLLTLQRLLGHASPSTTMEYLRYIDESDELVQRAFESWSDHERDYASYVLEQLEGRGA